MGKAGQRRLGVPSPTAPEQYYRIMIDPGLTGTGYAIFDEFHWKEPEGPVAWGNINAGFRNGDKWWERVNVICSKLESVVNDYGGGARVWRAHMEMAKIMSDSVLGQKRAETGDIPKLIYCTGALGRTLMEKGTEMVLYRVDEWKGQMPKALVERRVRARFDMDQYPTSHAMDATGIGLFAKGMMNLGRR